MWSYLPDIALQIAHDRRAGDLAHLSHGRPLHGSRRSALATPATSRLARTLCGHHDDGTTTAIGRHLSVATATLR